MDLAGFAMFLAMGAIGTAFLLGPIGQSIAKRIAGRETGADEEVRSHLADLEQRLAESERTQARLADLEERLDFAERMLSHPAAAPSQPEALKK
jgi:hypothetical protein